MEGQTRSLRLELETRLSMEVTPAVDVWAWLVRHAGWLLERYHHVEGTRRQHSKIVSGKRYQEEVMKFAEAALFRLAVSPNGRVRNEIKQGRADDDFSVAYGLARPQNPMNISSLRIQECTQRVKRVPDTEQRRANLVRSLQGTPWDRLAGRLAGRLRKTLAEAPPVATPPVAKVSERPSEDASVRRNANAQDHNLPVVPRVIGETCDGR